MESIRYIGLDIHRDTISAAVLNNNGHVDDAVGPGDARSDGHRFSQRDQRHAARHL